jgi:circadian clock protein KaiB
MPATTEDRTDAVATTRFTLYVAGDSARSQRAIRNIRQIVDSGLSGPCHLDIVDVLESPEQAERERILATPTLLRDFPPPRRRVTGDLSNRDQVLGFIAPELRPNTSEPREGPRRLGSQFG